MRNKHKTVLMASLAAVMVVNVSIFAQAYNPGQHGTDSATWRSIIQSYSIPQWYEDAKFGIFVHWGLFQVPEKYCFYGNWMYHKDDASFIWHQKNYGNQKTFGYKDFIPLYKMDKYDSAAWADLFVQSGAKYVMPIGIFHDGVPNYKSRVLKKFNLVDYPGACGKDVLRMLKKAVTTRGLHFGLTNQYLENWGFFCHDPAFDTYDTANYGIYNTGEGGLCDNSSFADCKTKSSKAFMDLWLETVKEQVDSLQPEIIFFDVAFCRSWYFDANYKPGMVKYYYDAASRWGKQVAINTKRWSTPGGTNVEDYEVEQPGTFQELFWQTDCPIAWGYNWSYVTSYNCIPARNIVRLLAENSAKNGSLLLAIGNKSDGTLPPCVIDTLRSIGIWLKANGEAIYNTRPWKVQTEGPTKAVGVYGSTFTKTDYRYTANKEWTKVYIMGLDWPANNLAILTALKTGPFDISTIDSISLINKTGGKLTYTQDASGLKITLPGTAAPIPTYPYALRMVLKVPTRDAFSQIEAESCNNRRLAAIKIKSCGDAGGGQCLDSARSNDWAVYANVNFGTGANRFEARVSAATVANSNLASIEVRLDDQNGPLVGTLKGACPGGVNNYTTLSCNLTAPATGSHTVILVFNPGFRSYNLNWFKFYPGQVVSTVPFVAARLETKNATVELYDLKGRLVARSDQAGAVAGRNSCPFLGKGVYIRKTGVGKVQSAAEMFVSDGFPRSAK